MIKKASVAIAIVFLLSYKVSDCQERLLDSTDRKVFATVGISSAAAFAGTYFFDASINNYLQDNRTNILSDYTDIANPIGDKWVILPLSAVTYGGSLVLKDQRLEKTSLNAFKSVISTGILTEGIKQLAGRARPGVNMGPEFYRPFPIFRGNKSAFKSLPSGHSSLAFAFFTPFAEEYSRWFYLIPASVLFSRVYKNKHWTSDVILGGTIGFLAGYFFQEKNRNIEVSFNKIVIKF